MLFNFVGRITLEAMISMAFCFFVFFNPTMFSFLFLSLSGSHEALLVIYLDSREGKPQGNTWQEVPSMIPSSFIISLLTL